MAINSTIGTDTTLTMKKDTQYDILYQNNNMLIQKKKEINKESTRPPNAYIYKSLK